MIINHLHKFCFFALPRTASQAISRTLLEIPASERNGRMHKTYHEFYQTATPSEKQYYKFCSVRNPLDSLVSAYFKIKTDHNQRFSTGINKHGHRPISDLAKEKFRVVQHQNLDFAGYFKKFHSESYRLPQRESTVRQMDFVIRFENLQQDFDKVMQALKLKPVQISPYNKTGERGTEYLSYYKPEIIPQAIEIFREIMAVYKYSFPEEWNEYL